MKISQIFNFLITAEQNKHI